MTPFTDLLNENLFDIHYSLLESDLTMNSHLIFPDNLHSMVIESLDDVDFSNIIMEVVKRGAKPSKIRSKQGSVALTVGDVGLGSSSKLRGIPHWSLNAGVTCPASICKDRTMMPSCQSCYAEQGRHVFNAPIELRNWNQADWRKGDWVKRMIKAIRLFGYFRWFESGDIYHPKLAEKIYEVIKGTPQTKHWLPTLSWKLPKIEVFIKKIAKLKNVAVRYSSGQVDGSFDKKHGTTIAPHELASKWFHQPQTAPAGVVVCPVGVNIIDIDAEKVSDTYQKTCDDCFKCFDRDKSVVVYAQHGRKTRRAKEHEVSLDTFYTKHQKK